MREVIYETGLPTVLPTCRPSLHLKHRQATAEEDMVERCHRGEPEAFDALFAAYKGPIYRLAYRLTGDYNDSHDITAEAFLHIYSSFGTFRNTVTLRAWIRRIVVNISIDLFRRKNRPYKTLSLEQLLEHGDSVGSMTVDHDSHSPQWRIEENERKMILDNAIAALPDRLRKMVTLYHQEDRSYEDIAEILQIPIGTIKSRLYRARVMLRKMLEPQQSALIV